MRLSLSHKLFAWFSILSLLTVILGITTFAVIKQLAESRQRIGLLQEFELRINAMEASTEAQSSASYISAESYENFRANLDRTKKIAQEILQSDYCAPAPNIALPEGNGSCQSIMLEMIDYYPQAVIDHFEKTLFTLRLLNKNRYIYKKMLETTDQLPQNQYRQMATETIHQLEMLKHDFEEFNELESIKKMRVKLQFLKNLKPDSSLTKLAETFINNNEQAHLNRQEINSSLRLLTESTGRFDKTAQVISGRLLEENRSSQQRILAVILFLSLVSVAMTLLFWQRTSRRLKRFLDNQKKAINSIKAGDYDYAIAQDTNDELSDLCTFTKELAANLKEEISEREHSQQAKTDLQVQLLQAQRFESVGLLTGGIAHDFNNILTGIIGYTDLALARLEDDHPVKRYLETISLSGQKACEMTRQLLAFSRNQEMNKQIINPNALISNLLKILTRMIGEHIVLELVTAPDLPDVMADPAQIEQVLINMAVNGKDAMPDGGKLTIKTSTVNLSESAVDHLEGVDPGEFVQISITDNGTGMTDEIRAKIFDPLFTTKANDRGTGLGLATAFEIIKHHNGHVTVDSAPGHGTTFNFFLPVIYAAPANEVQQPVSNLTIAKGQETILLVDDNDTARDFVCETLEYCGYKILTANSGSEAIKVMHQTDYPIDLLLTDVIMPGMNGKELAETIREVHPKIKVIFMSGYEDLPADHELKTMSPDEEFLKKPMSIEVLSNKVRKVLDR